MGSVRILPVAVLFAATVFFCGENLDKTLMVKSGETAAVTIQNECTMPLDIYLTAEDGAKGELEILRMQEGVGVVLFRGEAAALTKTEIHAGALFPGKSAVFTAQAENNGGAALVFRGVPRENPFGRRIAYVLLILGWGILALGGSALFLRGVKKRRDRQQSEK